MSKADEQVLCKKVSNADNFKPDMKFLQDIEGYSWERRGDCELDPTYKQLIPYVLLYDIYKDSYLAYYRKAGDGRLLGSLSIGVGGHINPCDALGDKLHSTHPLVLANINRELSEELGPLYKPMWDWWFHFRGFIYDSSDSVGRVHAGVVFQRTMTLTSQWEFEDDEHRFFIAPIEELQEKYEQMETWSQIVFDALVKRKDNPKFFRGGR